MKNFDKVLRTMIALVCVFLIALYVLKIFIPEQFIMIIENDKLIAFGEYVDNNLWLHIILGIITSFITYWLYIGAVTRKWCLNWKELVAVIVACISTQIFYYFIDTNIGSYISIFAMILIPIISNARLQDVGIVFTIHGLSQLLSMSIRGLGDLLSSVNYATILCLGIESYFWLLLFYLYFNLKGAKQK